MESLLKGFKTYLCNQITYSFCKILEMRSNLISFTAGKSVIASAVEAVLVSTGEFIVASVVHFSAAESFVTSVVDVSAVESVDISAVKSMVASIPHVAGAQSVVAGAVHISAVEFDVASVIYPPAVGTVVVFAVDSKGECLNSSTGGHGHQDIFRVYFFNYEIP